MNRIRALVVTGPLIALFAIGLGTSSSASGTAKVVPAQVRVRTTGCSTYGIRPSTIALGCATGEDQLVQLHWQTWGSYHPGLVRNVHDLQALGTGVGSFDVGTPPLMAKYVRAPVQVTLSDPKYVSISSTGSGAPFGYVFESVSFCVVFKGYCWDPWPTPASPVTPAP